MKNHTLAAITRKLATAGLAPQAAYDGRVKGFPTTELQQIRRAVAASIEPPKAGRCLTAFLHLELGDGDPAIKLRLDLFRAWLQHWQVHPSARAKGRQT